MASLMRTLPGVALAALLLVHGVIHGAGGTSQAAPLKDDSSPPTLADYDVSKLTLGGDFALTNQDGKRVRMASFRGRVVILFFGYTYCPDVCPVTMAKVGRVRNGFGKRAVKVQPVFVSVDPRRDTVARLKAYVENFDVGAVGLTGTAAEIAQVTALFRVRYEREESRSAAEYMVSHTAYLYMLDPRGKLRYVFPPDVDDKVLSEGVQHLMHG